MTKYVAGFLFDEKHRRVALIRKNKPEWQAGKLNGIGGKIEKGETNYQAMVREFAEETGQTVHGWRMFCVLHGFDWAVYFFEMDSWDLESLKNITDEKIEVLWVVDIPITPNIIPNLKWLIPMALDDNQVLGFVAS